MLVSSVKHDEFNYPDTKEITMSHDAIKIRGARTHNLKNIDIDIPRDKLVVITGLSGSQVFFGV